MYVIPIIPAALDLIEDLNGGVRPEPEAEATFFLYNGKDEHAEIVTRDWLKGREEETGISITIFHLDA